MAGARLLTGLDMFKWVKKKEPTSASTLQSVDEIPPGDAETITRVEKLCILAEMSAIGVAQDKTSGRAAEQWDHHEHERYQRLRGEAIALADTITDPVYQATALELLIELFMKAGDLEDARKLFDHLQVELFKKRVAQKHPQLTLRSSQP